MRGPDPPVSFAGLLRLLRTAAGLTQEELAEAASVTARSVSNLERGSVATPQKETVRLLADALQLIGPVRAEFETAARSHRVPGGVAVTRALPRDIASFTGRQQQLAAAVDRLELMATENLSAPAGAQPAIPAAAPALAGSEQALAWLRAERASLLACLDYTSGTGQHTRLVALTAALAGLLRSDGPWAEAITRHESAIHAAQHLGDRGGEVEALNETGTLHRVSGDPEQTDTGHREALDLARAIASSWDEAHALAGLGRCALATGQPTQAAALLRQALEILQRIGAAEAPEVRTELDALG